MKLLFATKMMCQIVRVGLNLWYRVQLMWYRVQLMWYRVQLMWYRFQVWTWVTSVTLSALAPSGLDLGPWCTFCEGRLSGAP